MATTTFGTNDSQTVKLWSKKMFRQALEQTMYFKRFLGTGDDAVVRWEKDLMRSNGDNVKYDLLVDMIGDGVTGSNTLEGNEEQLQYYQDSISINQLRHAHKFDTMGSQRTVHDLREDGKNALSRWWTKKFETYMFRALCGDTTFSFANTGTAPDSDHILYAGDANSEATLGSNDQFTLDLVNYAVEIADTLDPSMRRTMVDGKEYYILVLHPYSITDLELNLGGSTSAIWQQIQREAGVRGDKNNIFTGAVGVYKGVIIYSSQYIHSPLTGVRRNLLLGANAGTFATGNAYDKEGQMKYGDNNMVSWYEEAFDYGDKKGVAAGCVFGVKKNVFNSKDYGVLTIPTYAVSHNS